MSKLKVTPKSTITKRKKTQRKPNKKLLAHSPQQIIQRAQADPRTLTHDDVIQLQRTIGNRATADLIQRKGFFDNMFNRFFGISARRSPRFSPTHRPGMTATAESQSIVRSFRRQLRTEKKGIASYIHHNQRRAEQNSSKSSLKIGQILQNEVAWALFREHTKKEFSTENTAFVDFVMDRSKAGQDKSKEQGVRYAREDITNRQAQALVNSFVDNGSKFQINIKSHTRSNILRIMKSKALELNQNQEGWTAPVDSSLLHWFDEAVEEIYYLCQDSLTRFMKSDHAKYAELAIRQNATLTVWASQYQPFMDLVKNEKERNKRIGNRSWKQFLWR